MNAIETAVSPLKKISMDRARQVMQEKIDKVVVLMEESNWDLDVVAPRPKGNMSRAKYVEMLAYHNFIESVTMWTKSTRKFNEPNTRKYDQERVDLALQRAEEMAAVQYELYVAKLNSKIGEVVDATLNDARAIWNYSVLTVTKADGSVENWKTQCIVNVSVLGKLFNQWPTRKMK